MYFKVLQNMCSSNKYIGRKYLVNYKQETWNYPNVKNTKLFVYEYESLDCFCNSDVINECQRLIENGYHVKIFECEVKNPSNVIYLSHNIGDEQLDKFYENPYSVKLEYIRNVDAVKLVKEIKLKGISC